MPLGIFGCTAGSSWELSSSQIFNEAGYRSAGYRLPLRGAMVGPPIICFAPSPIAPLTALVNGWSLSGLRAAPLWPIEQHAERNRHLSVHEDGNL